MEFIHPQWEKVTNRVVKSHNVLVKRVISEKELKIAILEEKVDKLEYDLMIEKGYCRMLSEGIKKENHNE